MFQPIQQSFISGDDPCDARYVGLGPNPTARKANCESLGIDTDTFTSSISDGTISTGYVSGNPDLNPETSKSYTYGLAWTPDFVENLQIGLDYYNLEIEGAINDVTFETLAANCYDSVDFPNETACDTFTRGDDNQVIRAGNQPANVALATFEAVSLSVFYSHDLGEWGNLNIASTTQHNITNENQATATSEVQEDVGDFADPEWTGTFDINWMYEDLFVSHRVRWQNRTLIDSLEQQLYSYNYQRSEDGTLTGDFTNENASRFLHDLSIGYNLGTSTTVQLNVQNLLDRTADDLTATSFGFNQFGLDERLGRRLSLRFNHKF